MELLKVNDKVKLNTQVPNMKTFKNIKRGTVGTVLEVVETPELAVPWSYKVNLVGHGEQTLRADLFTAI